jgi:hypothetical protein
MKLGWVATGSGEEHVVGLKIVGHRQIFILFIFVLFIDTFSG